MFAHGAEIAASGLDMQGGAALERGVAAAMQHQFAVAADQTGGPGAQRQRLNKACGSPIVPRILHGSL